MEPKGLGVVKLAKAKGVEESQRRSNAQLLRGGFWFLVRGSLVPGFGRLDSRVLRFWVRLFMGAGLWGLLTGRFRDSRSRLELYKAFCFQLQEQKMKSRGFVLCALCFVI